MSRVRARRRPWRHNERRRAIPTERPTRAPDRFAIRGHELRLTVSSERGYLSKRDACAPKTPRSRADLRCSRCTRHRRRRRASGAGAVRRRGAEAGARRRPPLSRRAGAPVHQGVPPRALGHGRLYAADLYSSNWVAGGAYTFHFSEDLGLEASVQFTRFRSAVTDAYERRYPQIQVLDRPGQARASLLRAPRLVVRLRQAALDGRRHQPLRLQPGLRRRRDRRLHVPRRDRQRRASGTKFYFGKWFALRFDVRDHVLREVLVGDEHLVNDVVVTLGASVFIPFGG